MISFVSNYQDLSTDKGYQFKFFCDRCHNGFLSNYQANALGTAAGLLEAAGGLFGGFLGRAGESVFEVQRAIGGPAHDSAIQTAVDEAKTHFHQCPRCAIWVCPEVCWNGPTGLCVNCAPNVQNELVHSQSQATLEQVNTQVRQLNFTEGMDLKSPQVASAKHLCTNCHVELAPSAKFCGECGTPAVPPAANCISCGTALHGAKFCPECGKPASH